MRIGEVAARSGIPAHTIRFYEARKLVSRPSRTAANYRTYTDRVLLELAFIKRAQRLGFTIEEVREILSLGRAGQRPCEHVSSLCARHLREIERKMVALRSFRRDLKRLQRLTQSSCGLTTEGFCRAFFELDGHKRSSAPTRRAS